MMKKGIAMIVLMYTIAITDLASFTTFFLTLKQLRKARIRVTMTNSTRKLYSSDK